MIPKPEEGDYVDEAALADAEELLALRWKPTYADINAPDGVPHKILIFWMMMSNAKAESSNQPKAFGTIGEDDDVLEELLGGG